jgi:hypothetical protein
VLRQTGAMESPSRLVVEVREHPDAEPKRWTLECDPPGGDHPDPAGACAALAASVQPFAPVPEGRRCAQIWSGPERAVVSGTWRGRPVHAELSRTDSCEEARWRVLAAVLQPSARRD